MLDDTDVKKGTLQIFEPRAETLWDIEIEKENTENHKNEIRRRRRREDSINPNILPAISSSGVLLASLNNKSSNTIDFVFVLNVRESETFPPLLTQADVQCAEDKMALVGANTGFQNDALDWRNTFLSECINNRISIEQQQLEPSAISQKPAYETQITIVRISISCTCNELNSKKEECTTFAKEQKWTEYMGNQLDGTYNV